MTAKLTELLLTYEDAPLTEAVDTATQYVVLSLSAEGTVTVTDDGEFTVTALALAAIELPLSQEFWL